VRDQTVHWLEKYTTFFNYKPGRSLRMHSKDDYTPDEALKERWLNRLFDFDRERLVAVLDDRHKVVDMWRRNGVTCFQVEPGDF
jgi:hypothetical protein